MFAFSLVALLYLVVEELLVEAHEGPEGPLITAMFLRSSWYCSCLGDDALEWCLTRAMKPRPR